MKKIIILLTLTFLSANAFSGTVNLNLGEMVTISANTPTTVTCGGAGANCTTAIKNLVSKFQYCHASGMNRIEDCLVDIWPKFKKASPSCVEDAYSTCLDFCKQDPFGLECLKLCQ